MSSLYITPLSLQTEGSAEDGLVMYASQIVHQFVERDRDPGMSHCTIGKSDECFPCQGK